MTPLLLKSITELNEGAHRPADVPPAKPGKIGILGAGFMGAGIASVTALAGFDVILIDLDQAGADQGKARCAAQILELTSKGQTPPTDMDALLSHIHASADYADLADCDLIIESVFEDRAVKAEAIRKAQAFAGKQAVFASNTSTFPIASLATPFERPADFIGIHFFSPVMKMQLVEIIKTGTTGDRAIAMAFDYARAIGKVPIVVNDAYEFFTSRCVNAYLREGHLMLREGVPPAAIEDAAIAAGMPVGPLALSDEVGVDLILQIVQAMKMDLGPAAVDERQEECLKKLAVEYGRLGRKNGKGFYDYPQGAPKTLWLGLECLRSIERDTDVIAPDDLQARLMTIQMLEALRSFEQGIVTDPREADASSVLGFGFPSKDGGILGSIDAMGAAAFLARCERLRNACGERFAPSRLLRDMAAERRSFYLRLEKGTNN